MDTRGRHLLVEYRGCDISVLDSLKRVETIMNEAARAAGCRVVASVFHPFVPHGVTGVVVVEESHLSIHTWPEDGYAAVDFFTCGAGDPDRAHQVLSSALKAGRAEIVEFDRGLRGETGIALRRRRVERGGSIVGAASLMLS